MSINSHVCVCVWQQGNNRVDNNNKRAALLPKPLTADGATTTTAKATKRRSSSSRSGAGQEAKMILLMMAKTMGHRVSPKRECTQPTHTHTDRRYYHVCILQIQFDNR